MKKILISVLLLVVITTLVYLAWMKWGNPTHENKSNDSPKILFYQDPMHPWIKSDKPGKAPDCGMDLVPVYETKAVPDSGIVQIDPTMVQNIGVKTEMVMKRKLTHTIRTIGRVDYDETKQFIITTKFSGYIEKLFADYTGQSIQKGQPLFEIYSPELVAAQQEYLQAVNYKDGMSQSNDSSSIAGAEELLQSAKRKFFLWDISPEQIKLLGKKGEVKKSLTFYSPYSGVVIEKNIFDGMQVEAGMPLFKIANLSKMWVYADVYENELSFIKTGETATIELPYDAGKTLQGKISYIYPYLQDQTRTARVRIEIPDINSLLKKDMYVTVNIQPTVSINSIAVPEQSVIHSGKRDIVVLSLGEGKFKSLEVKLGVLADGYYEVKEGLKEGDMIVTSSQFLIDSESNLKEGMSSMQNMPGMDMKPKDKEEKDDMKNMDMK